MIKNHTLSLLFYLRKDKLNKKGQAPIYLRITVDGKRAEATLNRYIDVERWNNEAGRAKGNKEEIRELNNYLDTVKGKIFAHQRNMLDRDKPITAESLRNAFLGQNVHKHTLLELFQVHNAEMKQKIGQDFAPATFTRYETTLEHIKKFLKAKYNRTDILLTELDYKFITDLEHYLKTKEKGKCNHNSTLKYIRNFRKIIHIAVANEWLDRDPFMKFKSKLEESRRTHLDAEELKAIEEKEITIPRIDLVRDVFVFCCYTGFAYADVFKLTPNDIHLGVDGEKWVFLSRTKTGSTSNVPLLPPALAIIEKYKGNSECRESGKLLPVKSNQKMNAYLKELADLCDIGKSLNMHISRHTFATTVTLSNGVPIESVSKMLGHQAIRTTQLYAKVLMGKVSNDMAPLRDKLRETPVQLKAVK